MSKKLFEIKPLEWWMEDDETLGASYSVNTVTGHFRLEEDGGSYRLLTCLYTDQGSQLSLYARGPLEELKVVAQQLHEKELLRFLEPAA